MNSKNFSMRSLRALLLSLMCVFTVSVFTSCENNDEPDMSIGYYVSVESRVQMQNSYDPGCGQMITVTNLMKDAILDAYPVQTMYGDDAAVMKACDQAYSNYRSFYPAGEQNTHCVLKIYRIRLENGITKQSTAIKTYML